MNSSEFTDILNGGSSQDGDLGEESGGLQVYTHVQLNSSRVFRAMLPRDVSQPQVGAANNVFDLWARGTNICMLLAAPTWR